MSDSAIITFALIAAVTGIAYGLYLAMWVFKLDAGNHEDAGHCQGHPGRRKRLSEPPI